MFWLPTCYSLTATSWFKCEVSLPCSLLGWLVMVNDSCLVSLRKEKKRQMNLISRTSSSVRQRLWCQEKCQCHVICWVFIKIRLSWKVDYMTQGLWVSVLFSGVAEDVWHPTGLFPLAPHYSLYNHAKQLPNSSNGSTKASGNGAALSFISLGLFSHCSQEHDCNTLQIYPRQFNFCQVKQWYRWGLGRLGSAGSSLAHP